MESTGIACCARGAVLPNVSSQQYHPTALASPRAGSPSFISPKSLKASSLFGESLRISSRSSYKFPKAPRSSSLVTKCEIGDSLEEFLTKSTTDKGLISLMISMGEALRTIAFKVRTASCGGTACVNSFGDEQLAVDLLANKLLFEALQYSHVCKYACSEEVPELQDMGGPAQGGFSVAFDPLDGSSIVDTNFTVGTIFGVWPGDKLTGVTGADQVAAAMGIFGPRTTYVLALKDIPGTHEFLLLDEGKWQHVKDTTSIGEGKMFSPGNLRATADNPEYAKVLLQNSVQSFLCLCNVETRLTVPLPKQLIDYYVREKYTLRYTGGMVPDVNQIIVKEKGIFTNVASPSAKAKLRLLFEVAPLGFLIEKAGGYSSDGERSVLDKVINNLDERTQVAYGSKNEIIRFEETLYGSSRLKVAQPVGAAA
ncbi:UNVERIFIED_CONTAM: Sedoheptulose-1,7-bisphosphatase, chloroplastic [Sesamum radiatum]|uniref:Sedoheptulose-1,7-bisphosphatase, chloroplastic n=1 Tax=Sesamum radiatum TaxID=300843 RepID=A0AAW2KBU5_SESRA